MSALAPLRSGDPGQLGDYRLLGRLGQGGQGAVYLAQAEGRAQQVAIKLLHTGVADDPDVRRRLLGEIEAVRRVAPFCTAQVLDADLDGERPYIVSEYVDGVSLREHVIARGPRTGGSLDRLAIGTATALGAIHRAGVVHRDFKPGNVLLSLDGPRVIDFGISRLMDVAATTGRIPVGTPAYLAPEQIKGEPAGPPADLHAWALTVAFTASGRHAFTAGTYQEVMARILYGRPDLGPLSGSLREIVDACLAPEPLARPTAEEVLGRLLDAGPASAPEGRVVDVLASGAMAAAAETTAPVTPELAPDAPPERTRVQPGLPVRRPGWWKVAVMGVGLLAAVGGFVFWSRSGGEDPGFAGRWSGSAEHPAAGRVFPVELNVTAADGAGPASMRWGADLHCSGRLTRTALSGARLTLRLDRVRGSECYPGTLLLTRSAGDGRAEIKVTRVGDNVVSYSGSVARPF